MVQFRSTLAAVATVALTLFSSSAPVQAETQSGSNPNLSSTPPPARVEPFSEEVFGVRLEDPYRWMEKAENPELVDWIHAQSRYTKGILEAMPGRAALLARLHELSFGVSSSYSLQVGGSSLVYKKLDVGAALAKLMVREADGEERVLLDPQAVSKDGGHQNVDNYALSGDGKLVAYNLSQGGGEITNIHVMDTSDGTVKPDVVENIWGEFPASWLDDNSGYFYTQMRDLDANDPAADRMTGMRVRFHRLGTSSAEDPILLGAGLNPHMDFDPREFPLLAVVRSTGWALAMGAGARDSIRLSVARVDAIQGSSTVWQRVCEYEDGCENVDATSTDLYVLSSKDAPNRRVLRIPLSKPALSAAEVVIPESDGVLTNVAAAKDAIYVREMKDGVDRLRRLAWGSKQLEDVPMPFAGSIFEYYANGGMEGAYFSVEGWTEPSRFLRFVPGHGNSEVGVKSNSPADLSGMDVERVEVGSFDGTMVPLTILHRRGLKLDGEAPTILGGYGGYGNVTRPFFQPDLMAWLERGGIWAWAHVRGGGEKGRSWYLDGKGPNKPKGIKDFVACAEYLVAKRFTTKDRLVAFGASMGGVLVGRAVTERPDAFGSAVLDVGMLNVTRVLHGANGANQVAELGDPETAEGFKAVLAMDAYQNIRSGTQYPAIFANVGLNDGRVPPWNSAKFVARMQAFNSGAKPVLLRAEEDAGHGIGSTREQRVAYLADLYSFVLWRAGNPDFSTGASRSR